MQSVADICSLATAQQREIERERENMFTTAFPPAYMVKGQAHEKYFTRMRTSSSYVYSSTILNEMPKTNVPVSSVSGIPILECILCGLTGKPH
jgi:hypothetical protein